MAARKHLSHDEKTRQRIQTSQLINRLNAFAFGEVDISPAQVRAIEVLLKKSLPDLSSVEHKGEIAHSVSMVERRIVRPANPNG